MAEDTLSLALDSFAINFDPNDPARAYPTLDSNRMLDYKCKPKGILDQEERRREVLARQKKKRSDRTNFARRIVEENIEDDATIDDVTEERMDTTEIKRDLQRKKKKKFNRFKDQLMLSEWLVEVPPDLAVEWLTAICPIGKRCLVVANWGTTHAYTKSGYCVNTFPSLLPGGCYVKRKPGEYTILDCIYSEVDRTFYVLDIMCWKGHPVSDSETQFRFFWLRSKLSEESGVATRSKTNPYIFSAVPCFGTTNEEIYKAVTYDHGFQVDGLLFYHKRLHYYPERTPLVGWLKPYMVHYILNVCLPSEYLENMPPVNKLTLMESNKIPYGMKTTKTSPKKSDIKDEEMKE